MRKSICIFSICLAGKLSAQEIVTVPRADRTPVPEASPAATIAIISTSPAPREAPPQILPDFHDEGPLASPAPPSLPGVEQLDEAFRRSSLGKAADEARLHLQWRELENRTINDADLVAARAEAEGSRTDLEKRERLRNYYAKFFGRMKSRAGSAELRDYLQARENDHLALLSQSRVRPIAGEVAVAPTVPPKKRKHRFGKTPEPDLPH